MKCKKCGGGGKLMSGTPSQIEEVYDCPSCKGSGKEPVPGPPNPPRPAEKNEFA